MQEMNKLKIQNAARLLLVTAMLAASTVLPATLLSSRASAAPCPDGTTREGQEIPDGQTDAWCATTDSAFTAEDCRVTGGVWDSGTCSPYVDDPDGANCDPSPSEGPLSSENCRIIYYIVTFINILSGLAGIIIVASIIVGGIQYSAAGPDPQKVSAAKARIRNAVIALLLLLFGVGLINFLVPGGVF